MDRLFKILDEIDQINDEELLSERYNALADSNITKIFWEQRRILLSEKDPVIRKRALLKCRIINQYYGSSISVSRNINRFMTPHGFTGIHISAYAKIGVGCTIFQHVVIGSNTLPDSKNQGFPVIGDNVYIGAGAMIIGNAKIGNNVRIGANSIVTSDVPDNSVVVLPGTLFVQKETPLVNKFISANIYRQQLVEKNGKP